MVKEISSEETSIRPPTLLSSETQTGFSRGLDFHKAGLLTEAIQSYRHHLLVYPDHVATYNNLGSALGKKGMLEEAASCFRTVLQLNPDSSSGYNNLGIVYRDQELFAEAAECFRKALRIDPLFAEALDNLGSALRCQGLRSEAVACFRQAIALKPGHAGFWNNLGSVLGKMGNLDEAVVACQRALSLRPDYLEAQINLSNAFRDQGLLDKAVMIGRLAVVLKQDSAAAHSNLANALRHRGLLSEAEASCRKALDINPSYTEAYVELSNVFREQGMFDDAAAACRQALELRPNYSEAYNNLGNVLRDQGFLEAAIASYRKGLEHVCDDEAAIRLNLSMALLSLGNLEEGWKQYEWRWQAATMIKARRKFIQPRWRGEDAAGKVLLIHAEQGFGDTIQFCRYAGLAAARGLRVIVEAPALLVRLLQSLNGVDRVIEYGERLPDFDLHCPMLSLPLAFETTLKSIPRFEPYLSADKELARRWNDRLAAVANRGSRVGLVWAGNPQAPADRWRSIDAELLRPWFELPGIHFVSLQKPVVPRCETPVITDFMSEIGDFADTAALVANLDLVISVDTAVAHLAAALGKPTWLLDRFNSCWRWIKGRHDSPWYPALRLYRQSRQGDWESVIADVFSDLKQL